MVLGQLYYLIQEENDVACSSNKPLFGFVDIFFICSVFNKLHSFVSKFWFFLLSQLNSKVREEKQASDSELSHQERLIHGSRDDGVISRDEIKKVMEKMGFFCSSESEDLEESYGFNELSGVFEEEEPSVEEVKQAFDVFDENRDGFIDERELQRVLCVLGLKEATELGNCKMMIRNFDENGDGRIDFNEFVKIMENSFR